MSSEEAYTLDVLRTWKVEALKLYCRLRALKVSGAKEELVARVFAASEMGIPIAPTAEEIMKKRELEKASLLVVSAGVSLPDPETLETGWLDESNGMESWLTTNLSDITIYLMKDHPGSDVDLAKRTLNEYKEGNDYVIMWLIFAKCFFLLEPKNKVLNSRRALFEPAVKAPQTEDEKRELLYAGLEEVLSDSCFVMMKTAEHTEELLRPVVYDSLQDQQQALLTDDQINDIEKKTIGQSENEEWFNYRKGRITASNFHRVHPKAQTIRSGGDNTAPDKLLQSLQGSEIPKNLPSLKYGRDIEGVAKSMYFAHFQDNHTQASIRDCGLFIYSSKQYLGASPDALVECSCCGKGVLEIKCPSSIMYQTPLPENLPY